MECSKLRTAASNAGISIRRYATKENICLVIVLCGAPVNPLRVLSNGTTTRKVSPL
jgi:hypothetical protein